MRTTADEETADDGLPANVQRHLRFGWWSLLCFLTLGIVLESVSGLLDAGRYVFLFHLHRPVALVGKLGRGLPFTWETELTLGLATTLTWFALLMLWGWIRLVRMDITT